MKYPLTLRLPFKTSIPCCCGQLRLQVGVRILVYCGFRPFSPEDLLTFDESKVGS